MTRDKSGVSFKDQVDTVVQVEALDIWVILFACGFAAVILDWITGIPFYWSGGALFFVAYFLRMYFVAKREAKTAAEPGGEENR